MLKIEGLTVRYGKRLALNDINLTLEKGRFYALVGKNGSGKSSFLRAICNFVSHDGNIELGGKNVKRMSYCDRARKISYSPQNVEKVPFTAQQLIAFGRNPYGNEGERTAKFVNEAIERLELERLKDKRIDEMSGGERQLCYFAMNLCQDADIFLLDEPTSSLDLLREAEILSMVKSKTGEGKTAVVSMHNLSDAVKYADEIIVLDEGECKFFGSRRECLEKGIIELVFSVKRFNDGNNVFFSV